jgi:hypothetical protein
VLVGVDSGVLVVVELGGTVELDCEAPFPLGVLVVVGCELPVVGPVVPEPVLDAVSLWPLPTSSGVIGVPSAVALLDPPAGVPLPEDWLPDPGADCVRWRVLRAAGRWAGCTAGLTWTDNLCCTAGLLLGTTTTCGGAGAGVCTAAATVACTAAGADACFDVAGADTWWR